jgi:hypothetical protein
MIVYKEKKCFETEDLLFIQDIYEFKLTNKTYKLTLSMRILAIQCGFFLDSLLSVYLNV